MDSPVAGTSLRYQIMFSVVSKHEEIHSVTYQPLPEAAYLVQGGVLCYKFCILLQQIFRRAVRCGFTFATTHVFTRYAASKPGDFRLQLQDAAVFGLAKAVTERGIWPGTMVMRR